MRCLTEPLKRRCPLKTIMFRFYVGCGDCTHFYMMYICCMACIPTIPKLCRPGKMLHRFSGSSISSVFLIITTFLGASDSHPISAKASASLTQQGYNKVPEPCLNPSCRSRCCIISTQDLPHLATKMLTPSVFSSISVPAETSASRKWAFDRKAERSTRRLFTACAQRKRWA